MWDMLAKWTAGLIWRNFAKGVQSVQIGLGMKKPRGKFLAETPVFGNSRTTCKKCHTRTTYNGFLFISKVFEEGDPDRIPVRNCPRCGENIVPLPEMGKS
jgi:hypothetical protein